MTSSRKSVLIAVLLAFACAVTLAQENPGAAFAVSDGQGHVQLLWFPPASQWPAGGWRISDASGNVLVPKVAMGDSTALAALPIEDADTIRRLPDELSKPTFTQTQHKNFISLLGIRAFSDVNYAQALGLYTALQNAATGAHAYTIQGLDAQGNPSGQPLVSPAVDASQATPLPPSPDSVQAKVDASGVSLSWNPPPENRSLPAIASVVERNGSAISVKPFVIGTKWDPKLPLVVDRSAPPNTTVSYKIYTVDAFGRRSQASSIRTFFPDFRALAPPALVQATASAGKIVVTWTAEQKPNRAGYLVERAFMPNGPWEALMTQALSVETAQYEDDNLRGGTTYYYRVRAVGPRGDLGPPSFAASAIPTNAGSPPAVAGLAAEAGETRVRLTWTAVSFPVAGYFVERSTAPAEPGTTAATNWVRLNPHADPEPQYDDYIGLASGATLQYRVVAVALDNAEGQPSSPVQVSLPDRSLPGEPTITSASGAGGKVVLTFAPAVPEERTAQFLVLRSGIASDPGMVIGDPLPGSVRQYVDQYVSPDETYFYRLVAVDAKGDRSDVTEPVIVRVGAAAMPRPAPPVLKAANPPATGIILQFDQAPAGFGVVIDRQDAPSSGWTRVAGPIDGMTTSDYPPASNAQVHYRIAYVSSNGETGEPSDAVGLPVGGSSASPPSR
ncbi:MAG: fibronectin type III domain-containing protein [Terracidiphilus sp.]